MLKTMRRNVKSLKPIMWIVVATFVVAIFAIWGGAGRLGEQTGADTLANIERLSFADGSLGLDTSGTSGQSKVQRLHHRTAAR